MAVMQKWITDLSRFYAAWRKSQLAVVYPVLAVLFLVCTALYVGWHGNHVFSNIQDALVYPYFFQGFHFRDMVLPAQHANILKFPLFWLQAMLPYNFATLTAANLTLIVTAVVGWCALAARIFGRRYLPLISVLSGSVLLGSVSLGLNLIETTIRNIEYPIGLAFIMAAASLLRSTTLRRTRIVFYALIGILFALSFAGDDFMLYAFTAPLLLALALRWLYRTSNSVQLVRVCVYVVGSVILGYIVHKAVTVFGIAVYASDPGLGSSVVPITSFGPSLVHAISQLTDLFGADVFGQTLSLRSSIYFLNLVLLLLGFAGLILALRRSWRAGKTKQEPRRNDFVLSVLALSFFTTLGAYVFSNLALIQLANGSYVDASNIRYITLLPFLLVIGVVITLREHEALHPRVTLATVAVILLAVLVSNHSVRSSRSGWDTYATDTHAEIMEIIGTLKAEEVHQIVTGDSLGAPIRFWSNNTIKYASISSCDQFMPHNTRLSWRQPVSKLLTNALVIDRTGLDKPYLGSCTDAELKAIYGTPNKIHLVKSHTSAEPIEIWIYRTDLRQRLTA